MSDHAAQVRAVYAVAVGEQLGLSLPDLKRLRQCAEQGRATRSLPLREILTAVEGMEKRGLIGQLVSPEALEGLGAPALLEALAEVSQVIQPLTLP